MSPTLYPLASLSQIEKTPSREDGIPEDLEEDLKAYGCKLVQQAGILLKQWATHAYIALWRTILPIRMPGIEENR